MRAETTVINKGFRTQVLLRRYLLWWCKMSPISSSIWYLLHIGGTVWEVYRILKRMSAGESMSLAAIC